VSSAAGSQLDQTGGVDACTGLSDLQLFGADVSQILPVDDNVMVDQFVEYLLSSGENTFTLSQSASWTGPSTSVGLLSSAAGSQLCETGGVDGSTGLCDFQPSGVDVCQIPPVDDNVMDCEVSHLLSDNRPTEPAQVPTEMASDATNDNSSEISSSDGDSVSTEELCEYESNSCQWKFDKLTDIDVDEDTCDATCLFDKIYISLCGSYVITVHEACQPYNRLRQCDISVKDVNTNVKLDDPQHIAACELTGCLYVTDQGNKCIWRVAVKNSNRVDRLTYTVDWPYTLSVTQDGRLLIVNGSEQCLDLYQPADGGLQQIKLPKSMDHLYHAVQTVDGKYIISCGHMDSLFCHMYLVTSEGKVLRTYGGWSGWAAGQLWGECLLSLDTEGNVFVADRSEEESRFFLLDPQLQLLGYEKFGDYCCGMCFNKQLGGLLITSMSEWGITHSVKVCKTLAGSQKNSPQSLLYYSAAFFDGCCKSVCGIAYLLSRVFVLLDSSVINVYLSHNPFSLVNMIKLNRVEEPVDIAACSSNNCLYMSDRSKHCVWRVTSDLRVTALISNIRRPYRLSVTPAGQILVVNGQYGRLELYEASGDVDRHITLPDQIVDPRHAVMSLTGTVIVGYDSQQLYDDDYDSYYLYGMPGGVCELSTDGSILHSFSGCYDPIDLSLDSSGQLFVAGSCSRHVFLLDSQLKLKRKLSLDVKRVCVMNDHQLITDCSDCDIAVSLYTIDFITEQAVSECSTSEWDRSCEDLNSNVDDSVSDISGHSSAQLVANIHLSLKSEIVGIACLQTHVYIVTKSSAIFVYHLHSPYTCVDTFQVDDLKKPFQIAACEKRKYLYIVDATFYCLWRVKVDGKVVDRLINNIKPPGTVSVTPNGQILMANGQRHRLDLYEPAGSISRHISLPYVDCKPYHAVMSSTGTFIVSCRRDSFTVLLLQLSTDGSFLHTFSSKRLGWRNLHLSLHPSGQVFVTDTDFFKNQVLLLDSQPKLKLLLTEQHGLDSPRATCYIPSTNQLLVVSAKKVLLFGLSDELKLSICDVNSQHAVHNVKFLDH
jgi:DNA-binding beta-propeller fold protein YncE